MHRVLLGGLAVLLLAAGCGRCGAERPAGDAIEQVPVPLEGVVYVPHPERLGPKLAELARLRLATPLANAAGLPDTESIFSSLTSQLGVDVRSPEKLKEAGVAAERGVALVQLPPAPGNPPREVLILGIESRDALLRAVAALAQRRSGARVRWEPGPPGLTLFGRDQSSPELALLERQGWAFISLGPGCGALPEWLPSGGNKLASEPRWKESVQRLAKETDAYLHLPRGTLLDWPVGAVTFALTLEREGLRLQADLPSGLNPKVSEAFTPQPAADVSALLPEDAFAQVRFRGSAQALAPLLREIAPADVLARLREKVPGGEKELLALVDPGASLALSLAPAPPLAQGLPRMSLNLTNPFRYVHVTAVSPAKNVARTAALLEKLPMLAPAVGAQVERVPGPIPRYVTRYAQGEGLDFALADSFLIAASPRTRLEEALARRGQLPRKGFASRQDVALRRVLDEAAFAVVVDTRALDRALRGLPSAAFGIGGFAIRGLLLRWLDLAAELRGVAVGLTAQGHAAQAEVVVRWTPP
jgi:hypothetical protein